MTGTRAFVVRAVKYGDFSTDKETEVQDTYLNTNNDLLCFCKVFLASHASLQRILIRSCA